GPPGREVDQELDARVMAAVRRRGTGVPPASRSRRMTSAIAAIDARAATTAASTPHGEASRSRRTPSPMNGIRSRKTSARTMSTASGASHRTQRRMSALQFAGAGAVGLQALHELRERDQLSVLRRRTATPGGLVIVDDDGVIEQ